MDPIILPDQAELKSRVREHWERETCGTRYGRSASPESFYREIRESRFSLEPWIPSFQRAGECRGLRVLEIGIGAGSDFLAWLRAGANASGIDLTDAAVNRTREHLKAEGIDPEGIDLRTADAEHLPYKDGEFDVVYSYGALHHTPDDCKALAEAHRVLAPGGILRIMLYHGRSWTALMLWTLHGPFGGRPFITPRRAVFDHLESPGTKCYTVREARSMLELSGFENVKIDRFLGPGDLLAIRPSDRYDSFAHRLLWKLYPRPLVRLLGPRFGIIMLVEAEKPLHPESRVS